VLAVAGQSRGADLACACAAVRGAAESCPFGWRGSWLGSVGGCGCSTCCGREGCGGLSGRRLTWSACLVFCSGGRREGGGRGSVLTGTLDLCCMTYFCGSACF
jgi:hypothetical protein